MQKYFYAAIIGLSLFSCSTDSNSVEQNESQTEEQAAVVSDSELKLDIEGMVCAHGCGSSIKKALKATGGVEKVSIDFEEERASNELTIRYDSKKISKKKIETILAELNEGQFTCTEVSNEKIENSVSEESTSSDEKETPAVSAVSGGFEIPNLLEILSGLIL